MASETRYLRCSILSIHPEEMTVIRIRRQIKYLPRGTQLEVKCFSQEEADKIKSMLSEQELKHIARFTWLTFPS